MSQITGTLLASLISTDAGNIHNDVYRAHLDGRYSAWVIVEPDFCFVGGFFH